MNDDRPTIEPEYAEWELHHRDAIEAAELAAELAARGNIRNAAQQFESAYLIIRDRALPIVEDRDDRAHLLRDAAWFAWSAGLPSEAVAMARAGLDAVDKNATNRWELASFIRLLSDGMDHPAIVGGAHDSCKDESRRGLVLATIEDILQEEEDTARRKATELCRLAVGSMSSETKAYEHARAALDIERAIESIRLRVRKVLDDSEPAE